MADKMSKNLSEDLKEFRKLLAQCNKDIKENNLEGLLTHTEQTKIAANKYAKTKKAEVFADLKKTQNPVLEFLKIESYEVPSFKEEKNDAGILQRYTETQKRVVLNLREFCSYLGLNLSWVYDLENFNLQFAIMRGERVEMDKTLLDRMERTFLMSKQAYAQKSGEHLTSNTQIGNRMQEIFDKILFVDDGNGKNKYKVIKRDIAFLLDRYSTRDKKNRNAVKAATPADFMANFVDMMHCKVTDKKYEISYKAISEEKMPDYEAFAAAAKQLMDEAQKDSESEKVSKPKKAAKSKKKVSEEESAA